MLFVRGVVVISSELIIKNKSCLNVVMCAVSVRFAISALLLLLHVIICSFVGL